jgi:hypothetical protein
MRKLLVVLGLVIPLSVFGADVADRVSFIIILTPTGRNCETYYSLHAAELICRNDVEYRRQFRVTYIVDGKKQTADLDWIPEKKFAVAPDGMPINPDTSSQYKTETQH